MSAWRWLLPGAWLSLSLMAPELHAAKAAPKPVARPVAKPGLQAPPAGDARLGRDKAEAERCFECHGEQGLGVGHGPEAIFARLAGQKADYIEQQVRHFKAGLRKNDSMLITARAVDPEDLRDIAAYFAQLPVMQGEGALDPAAHRSAQDLTLHGDPARGIAACSSCHGAVGEGLTGSPAPRLAGQESRYLAKQLRDFQQRQRREAVDSGMAGIASALREAEIEQLASYFSRQGAASAPR
ncbi:c-type cytochrome [Pelomonas sp. BJYL3]|uniref:c-type cytochrome n=1 Tax=Pelomonas sp. BJYL3 TaxID=2976697 RepID=UPI0022B3EBFA|nr:c-type cytochrome [Pelomonas sp. BJYL3]